MPFDPSDPNRPPLLRPQLKRRDVLRGGASNKIARICYATLRDGEHYRDLGANPERTPQPERKLNRESFAMPG